MDELLSERFAAAQSSVIEFGSGRVVSMYEMSDVPELMRLTMERATGQPVQGLRIRASGAQLEVNGRTATDVVLWWDSAPSP